MRTVRNLSALIAIDETDPFWKGRILVRCSLKEAEHYYAKPHFPPEVPGCRRHCRCRLSSVEGQRGI